MDTLPPRTATDLQLTPDRFLARRAVNGEARAWEEIVERYGQRIYNLAYRFTGNVAEAEELTQDIFLKLYRQLHRYRGEVPLVAWALRLSRNLCIDHYRHHRKRKESETASPDVLLQVPSDDDPRRRVHQLECRKLVHRTMSEMSETLASVLMLRDIQGLTYDEIAHFLEVPVGTIKSRLSRARKELVKRIRATGQTSALMEMGS